MTFVQIEEGGRVLTVDIMKCITSTERKASSFSLSTERRVSTIISWRWVDFFRPWILDLSDAGCISGMAGIYAARLVPDKGQKSDEKTGRKNTSRAPAAVYIQQGEEKRGHSSSPFWDYRVETLSRAFLAPLEHNQCNWRNAHNTTQWFQLSECTHILLIWRGNVKMLHGRKTEYSAFEEKGIFLIFPLPPLRVWSGGLEKHWGVDRY